MRQRRNTAGDLKVGESFWWAGHRLTIHQISLDGYGHRKGTIYRHLVISGTTRGGADTHQVRYRSDERIER